MASFKMSFRWNYAYFVADLVYKDAVPTGTFS